MYTDQCLCIIPVFMYIDQRLCIQASVYVYRPVFPKVSICLSRLPDLTVDLRLKRLTTLRTKDNRTAVRVGFEVNEMAALRYSSITDAM
jgi:hypothetical protein